MDSETNEIRIIPIGTVINDFEETVPEGYETSISRIVLREEFSESLHMIEENSHIVVVFWMNKVKEESRRIKSVHPMGREDLPLLGVFATRSPRRPNPLGIRAVELVEREDNVLMVKGLDALNLTPVVDIKPYSLKHDLVKDAKAPWWTKYQDKGNG
jgi:tRNA-Thr(GGU) m(6)t(6)A37 methyltransferase TsaA